MFFPAFLGDIELDLQLLLLLVAVIQTVVGKENISTFWGRLIAGFWSWFLFADCFMCSFSKFFQVAPFVNYYLSGFMYLLIVIVVRVHLHDSVDTLNVTTRKSRNISKTNRISLHIQWSILSGLNLPQLCMIAKPKK